MIMFYTVKESLQSVKGAWGQMVPGCFDLRTAGGLKLIILQGAFHMFHIISPVEEKLPHK